MRRDAREWSVSEPFRALLWWPAVSFVVGIAAPEAAVVAIIVSGLVLALTGALVHAVGRRWRRTPVTTLPQASEPTKIDTAA